MRESTSMGMNRTGVQMSPFDSAAMQATAPPVTANTSDESAIGAVRIAYIDEAEPLGSVPVPGTVTGAITAGLSMLSGHAPQIFIDKLGERLAFERTGTRLYDALIAKCEAMHDDVSSMTIEDIRKIRTDEAHHFAMVADAIESLGGDPTAETPSADLVGIESSGLVQVLTDPRTSLAQSLHAILTAELADQSGWELLIALAEENQQPALSSEFNVALMEEREHLQLVRQWHQEAVLGVSYSPTPAPNGHDAQTQTP